MSNFHTHFHRASNGIVTAFSVEDCETCGRQVQAANAMTVYATDAKLLRLGMTKASAMPPEQWHNDELGQCDCEREDCHSHLASKAQEAATITPGAKALLDAIESLTLADITSLGTVAGPGAEVCEDWRQAIVCACRYSLSKSLGIDLRPAQNAD